MAVPTFVPSLATPAWRYSVYKWAKWGLREMILMRFLALLASVLIMTATPSVGQAQDLVHTAWLNPMVWRTFDWSAPQSSHIFNPNEWARVEDGRTDIEVWTRSFSIRDGSMEGRRITENNQVRFTLDVKTNSDDPCHDISQVAQQRLGNGISNDITFNVGPSVKVENTQQQWTIGRTTITARCLGSFIDGQSKRNIDVFFEYENAAKAKKMSPMLELSCQLTSSTNNGQSFDIIVSPFDGAVLFASHDMIDDSAVVDDNNIIYKKKDNNIETEINISRISGDMNVYLKNNDNYNFIASGHCLNRHIDQRSF